MANIKWIAFGRLSLLHCAFPEKSGFSSAVIGVITMSFLVWPLAIQSVPFPAKSVTLGVPKIRWKISCFNPRPTKCTLQDLTKSHKISHFFLFICYRNRVDFIANNMNWYCKTHEFVNCHRARKFSPGKQASIKRLLTLYLQKGTHNFVQFYT